MAGKNEKRRPAELDFHHAVAALAEAYRLAHEWATRCLSYRDAGRKAQARAAEEKTRYWLAKTLVLRAQSTNGKSQGGVPRN
jgi:hypothetical protein